MRIHIRQLTIYRFQLYYICGALEAFSPFQTNYMILHFTRTLVGVLIFLMGCQLSSAQQLEITGQLLNADTELPIAAAQVSIEASVLSTQTDAEGRFTINMDDQTDVIRLLLSHRLYESLALTIQPTGGQHDVGTIFLTSNENDAEENLPVIVLNEQVFGDDDNGSEDVSGLLSASRDPFAEIAAFDLSWGRFRMRGLPSSEQDMTMNGILTNDLETGSVRWSLWGGLNDAVRARRDVLNLNSSDFAFGGLGGSADIDIRPSAMRKYTRFSYASSNGNYRHRLMGFHNSGLNDKGWGIAASASRRYAEEGYVEGTFYDAWSYFLSIEKKVNDKHSLNLAAFGSYNRRGRSSAVTQEVYDLKDPSLDQLYNPNWGYQAGEKRNGRINTSFQPVFLLTHDWSVSDKIKVTTGGMYRFGQYGNTRLDWNNAADPRPNYYRYLPSWQEDPEVAERVRQQWLTNTDVSQINWDRMININRNVNETIKDVDGIGGNNVTGRRSRFIVEEQRFDPTALSLSTTINAVVSDKFEIYGGVNYIKSRTDNYKVLDDLLGGEFILDVDKFAESDFVNPNAPAPDIIQNDLQNPNRLAREGDIIGYNYEIHTQQTKAWLQGKFENQKIIFYLGGQVGQGSFWRNGIFQNGIHPTNSLGESEKNDDFLYGIKAGLTYKIDGRNYLYVNATTGEDPAVAREGFLSPRVNNSLNPYNETRKFSGFDAGYQVRSPFIKARISVFRNHMDDWTESLQFYNDFQNSFGSYVLGNIDAVTEGVEAGVQLKVSPTLTASGGFSLTDNRYTSRAISSVVEDRSTDFIILDETVYTKGYKLSGSPNTVGNVSLTYRSPKFWWVELGANYFADNYISVSPVRRRTEAVELLDPESELYNSILEQEKVEDGIITNLSCGYSYRIKHGEYIRLFISVTNLLDKTDFVSGGYEQLRFDNETKDPTVFPSRYYYSYGRTFFASITYQF